MKKLLIGILITYILTGCSTNSLNKTKEEIIYDTSTYITGDMKENIINSDVSALHTYEYTPENLYKNSDVIAIIKVITLDGITLEENTVIGDTYGKALINSVLYGNIKEDTITYFKAGGVVSIAEWEKYQPQEANEKRKQLRENSSQLIDINSTYYSFKGEDDIEIEAGKTYLAYLKENGNKYQIIGAGNGLRELQIEQTNKISSEEINLKNQKIKNNVTGEFESLDEYIEKYIK